MSEITEATEGKESHLIEGTRQSSHSWGCLEWFWKNNRTGGISAKKA